MDMLCSSETQYKIQKLEHAAIVFIFLIIFLTLETSFFHKNTVHYTSDLKYKTKQGHNIQHWKPILWTVLRILYSSDSETKHAMVIICSNCNQHFYGLYTVQLQI